MSVKNFSEFVGEEFLQTAFHITKHEQELIAIASYDLAKKVGMFLQYFVTSREYVEFAMPSSYQKEEERLSSGLNRMTSLLSHMKIQFTKPTASIGAKSYLRVNYQDLIDYGKTIYNVTSPHTS